MVLIFLGVLIVFTVSSFEFQQARWIIRYGGNTGVLTQAAAEAKNSSRV